jgi:hypothetical protein
VTKVKKRLLLAAALLLAIPVLFVCVEHYRGQWALAAWEKAMRAKGEKFTVDELRPPLTTAESNGAPAFLRAMSRLQEGRVLPRDGPSLCTQILPGKAIVVWQQPQMRYFSQNVTFRPGITYKGAIIVPGTNTWENFDAEIEMNADALVDLRQTLQKPVLDFGVRYYGFDELLPHLSPAKKASQWLAADAIYHLRRQELPAALDSLQAISDMGMKHRREMLLISQLVSLAELTIGLNATWSFLQSPELGEIHLKRLYEIWQADGAIESMGRSLEMERGVSKAFFDRLRKGGATEGEIHFLLFSDINYNPASTPAPSTGLVDWFKDYCENMPRNAARNVYYPLWRFCWGDWTWYAYAHSTQTLIDDNRRVAEAKHWKDLESQSWWQGMWEDQVHWKTGRSVAGVELKAVFGVISGLTKSSKRAAAFETYRSLTLAVIALKRHWLRFGQWPEKLEVLVPEFLPQLPMDYFAGQPPCYRRNNDDTFTLYSVGENGKDDGGEARDSERKLPGDPWRGLDFVWPWPATVAEIAEYDTQFIPKK